jgi:hypothetical protein
MEVISMIERIRLQWFSAWVDRASRERDPEADRTDLRRIHRMRDFEGRVMISPR